MIKVELTYADWELAKDCIEEVQEEYTKQHLLSPVQRLQLAFLKNKINLIQRLNGRH